MGKEQAMDVEETDTVVIAMGTGGTSAGRLAEAGRLLTGVEARLVAYPTVHGAIDAGLQGLSGRETGL
jgi:hypothetical protein